MNLSMLLLSMAVITGGGFAALPVSRWPRLASAVGAGAAVVGCALGLGPALRVLIGWPTISMRYRWAVPFGEFHIVLDPLSAVFLVAILVLGGLAALYGVGYLRAYHERKPLGPTWFFFNLLIAGMMVVVLARNAVLFLVAWEIMSLAAFFLVIFEHEHESVLRAGWTYLVATHLGTAFLLAMFVLLSGGSGRMDFGGAFGPARANLLFILAVIGFGTKAGFMPLHVWLPEAHPAAPSHVSAVMSGVMIKTGIYGLLRVLTLLGPPPAWWGWLLIGIGLVSGVLGVLFALAQHDLKRLLAYHSVENIGIIALGMGVGVLGVSRHSPAMAVLGFGGCLLHVVNHACFKGLLFLGAGAVLHGAGGGQIDRLGGLLRRMPWTGWSFLIGAAAISGLPPLNGFVSELLIYVGALEGLRSATVTHLPALVGVIAGLALIGGLAVACFTKAFGVVFLGEPRTPQAAAAHECGLLMRLPMLVLAAACVAIGLLGPLVVRAIMPAIAVECGLPIGVVRATAPGSVAVLVPVTAISAAMLLVAGGLAIFRRRLLGRQAVTRVVTWDCGYARGNPRMQYTASSFAQPLTLFFQPFLRSKMHLVRPEGYYPTSASLATHTDDVCQEGFWRPVFWAAGWMLSRLRWLQHGRLQLYVLYIALTLLALLLWKLA